jgi:hypothetical protein
VWIRKGWLAHPFAAVADFSEPAEKAVAGRALSLRVVPKRNFERKSQ